MLPVLVPMAPSSTLTFEDRTEVRTRTTDAGKFADDIETDPALRYNATMRHGQDGFSIAYTPRILFADAQGDGREGQILNGGSAVLELHRGRTSFVLGSVDQYGTIYANSIIIPARWKGDGAPAVIYSLPALQSAKLTYVASYTSAILQQALTPRLNISFNGQYGIFGGPDQASRQQLPLVSGPTGEVKLEYNAGHRDDVSIMGGVHYAETKLANTEQVALASNPSQTVTTQTVQTDPALVGYGELRYRHKWSRAAMSEFGAGAAVAHQTFPSDFRVDVYADRPNTIPYPTGDFLTILNPADATDRPHKKVQAVFDAKINPWFSPFGALNEERAEFSGALNYLFDQNVLRLQGSFYHVLPTTDTPGNYTFALGEIDFEHKLSKAVTLDVGVRVLWQTFQEKTVNLQGVANAAGVVTGTQAVTAEYHESLLEGVGFVGLSWQPTPIKL